MTTDPKPWDVVVVGAGAAGLLARAAEFGARTLVLEKNTRAGVKILMSGGTRCNLTQSTDRRGIVDAYGQQGPFLHSALAALSPGDLVELVESQGVATKVEPPGGKVFPVSDRAADVLSALLDLLSLSGAILWTRAAVQEVERVDSSTAAFRLTTERGVVLARTLIITTGGKSYPASGTSGDGYPWARRFGHRVTALRPALTPITSNAQWLRSLRGLTASDIQATLRQGGEAAIDVRRGSLLFTHFGVSGPVVLDLSRGVSGHTDPRALTVECDFWVDRTDERLDAELRQRTSESGARTITNLLHEWLQVRQLPRRLVESLVRQAGVPEDLRAAELSKRQRRGLLEAIKRTPIPVEGVMGFRKAEVTAGGVALDEVDSSTMQSKLVPRLFWAGEILDLDGPIGGYNFQAAFSTGWLAGEKAACL